MTEVHHFYPSHHLHHLGSLDNMPDEDEVRNIAGPLMSDDDDFLSTENSGIRRRQDRALSPLCADGVAAEVADLNNNVYSEDGHRGQKYSSREEEKPTAQVVAVSTKDVAVSYQVHGLRPHEMPVIGFHVDSRIMPGFQYRVRIASRTATSNSKPRYQFQGQALHLIRLGQGYGKRLTFTPDSLNENTNYFWSDSNPGGYGFSLVAVQAGDKMVLTDFARRPIGTGLVEEASPCQVELSTELVPAEDDTKPAVVKRVSVILKVRLRYTCERHGIRSLRADETVIVRGVAKVVKPAGESTAHTKCIEKIELQNLGECFLYMV